MIGIVGIETGVFIVALLLLLGISVSKLAARFGVPALLVFLLIGLISNPETLGLPVTLNTTQALSVFALMFILFAGGFSSNWLVMRPVLREGLIAATLGVLLTALMVGAFALRVLNFDFYTALLLGAIISSTDAAAVFAVLRTRGVRLRGRIEPLLELESGSNDPMAIFLTIGLTTLIVDPSTKLIDLPLLLLQQMGIGGVIGIAAGRVIAWAVNRIRLEYEGLYIPLTVALVLFTYSLTALLGGSGFLTVYLVGLYLGQVDLIHKRSLSRFFDGLAWLMQVIMFLTLGLLINPANVISMLGAGVLVSIFLIFVARPLSVYTSLALAKMPWRDQTMIAWVGLRGAAPIILATFPLTAGVPGAEALFNIVFFVVVISILLQATTIPFVARLLRVGFPAHKPRFPFEIITPRVGDLKGDLVELHVHPTAEVVGKQIVDLHLPKGLLIVLIGRDDRVITVDGGTVVEPDDTMLVLAEAALLEKVRPLFAPSSAGNSE